MSVAVVESGEARCKHLSSSVVAVQLAASGCVAEWMKCSNQKAYKLSLLQLDGEEEGSVS